MRCTHCNKSISSWELEINSAHELMGVISHVSCDIQQLSRQEKMVKYIKRDERI